MEKEQLIRDYWQDVADQNADKLKNYFVSAALIKWHNTNECFNVEEFITANCEYPGEWRGEVDRMETIENTVITVTRVWASDDSASFHVTSFFEFEGDKIKLLNEYWGDDGAVPQWRLDKRIGRPIHDRI